MNDHKIDHDALARIADELPGTWTAERVHDYGGRLIRDDGLRLFAHRDHTGKVEVFAAVAHEHLRYDEDRPRIGLTLTKKGAAADIVRRLLPDAEQIHRVVAGRQALADAAKVGRDEARTRLERTGMIDPPSEYDRDDTQIHIKRRGEVFGSGSLRYAGDGVSLDLHGLTIDQAEKILTALTD